VPVILNEFAFNFVWRAELSVVIRHAQQEAREFAIEQITERDRGGVVICVHAPDVAIKSRDRAGRHRTGDIHFDHFHFQHAVQRERPHFVERVAEELEAFQAQLFLIQLEPGLERIE
jgi:hypothetical protein